MVTTFGAVAGDFCCGACGSCGVPVTTDKFSGTALDGGDFTGDAVAVDDG
jgi:hypothetical protein